eukprot:9410157-Prorocentrum_lima.AAC.1
MVWSRGLMERLRVLQHTLWTLVMKVKKHGGRDWCGVFSEETTFGFNDAEEVGLWCVGGVVGKAIGRLGLSHCRAPTFIVGLRGIGMAFFALV